MAGQIAGGMPPNPRAGPQPSESFQDFISRSDREARQTRVLASVSLREPELIAQLEPGLFEPRRGSRRLFESEADILAGTARHKPDLLFSRTVLREAASLPDRSELFANRPRVEGTTFTIDAYSSQDLDDGLSYRREGNTDIVTVSAADVTAWVSTGSALDFAARQRSQSVYAETFTLPVFPVPLSEDLFSLHLNQDRLAITCEMRFDATTKEFQGHDWKLTVFRNDNRLNKTDAAAARDDAQSGASPELRQALLEVSRIAHVGKGGAPSDNTSLPSVSRVLEWMIVTSSKLLASDLADADLDTSYRNQAAPNERASYGAKPLGHASMGVDAAVQWTSGIRRYPDLDVHRVLKRMLEEGSLSERGQEIASRLRDIQHARDNHSPIRRRGTRALANALAGAKAAMPEFHMTRRPRSVSGRSPEQAMKAVVDNYGYGAWAPKNGGGE